ncbi:MULTISPECIES: two-partner secretion domain-containing protein [Burkholderia]|uniref:Filamentous hemagglutinin N-terminal domain-containing protein n=1 Tax=Burkholderia contaminans TaxID=488447 RepID=A0A2S5DSG9_9BURK|nr:MULTISPECIES: filamentous hemagglutinin N-terminal domain-containing protein [Burkholderia]EKS9796464.1 filamentous hemagglutinin N-terminal domain-containing protein [Burkholderia cepacia]EKS9803290.1 filamentous hemagglutinin N-terminal domain-containing protein [Burkholderia cepacia]EKS9812894.1 filamentous hemagglutinin N-terminal domain-containing protein [Burkholderia cepacia]EKS9823378.1 filamentous hemagglutinin N-terminal domain-containing protein [Burkholderia cepacia]EKS9825059.1
MNKAYALVWNARQGVWQAVGERVRRHGKSATRVRVVAVAALFASGAATSVHALPTGENVVSGKADILRYDNGQQMSINQHTDKLVTNWQTFDVDKGQRVTFNQPSVTSTALNRVVGQDASAIYGTIEANGRVFLVNPNGILFSKSAQVNVGGLVATTLDIKNDDFEAGRFRFSGKSPSEVQNYGNLVASEGGAIALLGAKVVNRGTVQAQLGTVALGAGSDATLNFDGSKLLSVQIDQGIMNALVSNEQLLKADGGRVLMGAKTVDTVLRTVVNNLGTIEARTLRNVAGRISLDGHDAGTVNVAGVMNASAATPGNGGTVDTRGADVKVALGAMVDTRATNGRGGTWRIASSDVSVTAGANQPGTIVADTLSRNLATTDVELIAERGAISVDGPVTWASGNRLALTSRQDDVSVTGALRATGANARVAIDAKNSVRIAAPIALTGANALLTLDYGVAHSLAGGAAVTLSGAGAGFESNGYRYTVIQNLQQLQGINTNLGGLYVLGNAISGSCSWYACTTFKTIGSGASFFGVFDGLGNSISNLVITSSDPYAGLFGRNTGTLANLNLKSLSVSAASGVGPVSIGGLVGENAGKITNVTATGMKVSAGASRSNALGGLVGINRGELSQSSYAGSVTGNGMSYAVGGLVGENRVDWKGGGIVSDGDSNATVSGGASNLASIGGLVGVNRGGDILNSTSRGTTSGVNIAGVHVGGLVGANLFGTIFKGTALGRVTGGGSGGTAGGLVGLNTGKIVESIASGVVDGRYAQAIGGFVGLNQGNVTDGKAMGAVMSASTGSTGGFVGSNVGADAVIYMSEAHGAVTGGQGANGGFVGSHLGGKIAHSVARGKTTGGNYSKTGGFVGSNAAELTNNDASGDVSGGTSASVGGFAGANTTSGTIETAWATGKVSGGSSSTVGGFAGENLGTVLDATASGTVSAGYYATLGGLIGLNAGLVERSGASGRINVSSYQTLGGLVGINRGIFRNSFVSGEAALQRIAGLNLGVIE